MPPKKGKKNPPKRNSNFKDQSALLKKMLDENLLFIDEQIKLEESKNENELREKLASKGLSTAGSNAGRRYQHVFRRANILPYFSHVQCLYLISKTINKSFCAKLVLLQLNVAPVPGIALGWVWRLGPRAVQPADGGLLPPDVGGALGEGERFDPVGHSSAEQQTNAAPLPRRLSGSLPQQYCGRCTLVKITPISTRPWRGDER